MKLTKKKLKEVIYLDAEFNQIQDVDILLERILFEARKIVNADAGSIYVVEQGKLAVKYAQNDTKQKELPPGQKLIYSIFQLNINKKTIAGYVAETGNNVNIKDVYNLPKGTPYSYNTSYDQISEYKTHSVLAIPLRTNTGDIIGVIQMINAKDEEGNVVPFKQADEILVLHFADNAAIALQRAQMTRAIILRMIRMAELRDPKETGAHVNRVAGYAVEIYEKWALNNNIEKHEFNRNRDLLRMAAMLHDVGKVAISDVILKKPARFTEEEHKVMMRHTYLGARLFLDKQSEFDEFAEQIALTHHDRWDGKGYPGYIDIETGKPCKIDSSGNACAKAGNNIPLWGRIVAIADVYDALSSKRVYKEAWEEDKVLAEMKRLRGKYFDPDLLDVFFEVLPSIRQISERYREDK